MRTPLRYYRLTPEKPAETGREKLEKYLHVLLWRRAAHWMFLRWQVRRDRADWPSLTCPPLAPANARG